MSTSSFRATVAKCVGLLGEAFGRKTTEHTFEVYIMGLDGLTTEQVMTASRLAASSCKFMPTPAELRELSGELRISDRAEIAWQAWENAIRKHGGYKTLDFDDPAINATIRAIGGVQHLLDMDDGEYNSFARGRFLKAYEANFRAGVTGDVTMPLLGSHDIQNAKNNFATSEPIRIITGLSVKPTAERIAEKKTIPTLTLKKA